MLSHEANVNFRKTTILVQWTFPLKIDRKWQEAAQKSGCKGKVLL